MNLQSAINPILPVTCHTDYVGKDSTFVAIKGQKQDGIDFIPLALVKGATKIIVSKNMNIPYEIVDLINHHQAKLIQVDDCRQELTKLSAACYEHPAKKLNIIGITGTKGKTTTTYLMHHLLSAAGYRTAMISGVENIIGNKRYSANLTTPLPDYLHAFLNRCVNEKIQFVVMESSAQAFSLKRLDGIEFAGAIFTNLDLEHMEFYNSMDEYFEAKCQIFNQIKSNCPVIVNVDNKWANKAAKLNKAITLSFDENKNSNFNAKILKNNLTGLEISIKDHNRTFNFLIPSLLGEFNAYNIACAVSLCLQIGMSQNLIAKALSKFSFVPGRMERYMLRNGAMAVVDYAHNPSSFSYVLPTLKTIANRLIVVFGAGGDRDKQKRPIMGNIATEIADKVIITSDNPRSENVQDIINQLLSGVQQQYLYKVSCESDRAQAILLAYNMSKEGDVIAILGKGPDEYQIFGDKKSYFSDKETIINFDKQALQKQ